MVSPRVANGGDGFQTCVKTPIFSKQKRATDKRWFCSLGVGQRQILTVTKWDEKPGSCTDFWNDVSNGNVHMRFGT